MQQYHPLQRAQSCQSKPDQPHQQRWTWWQTVREPLRQHSKSWMHPSSRPQVRLTFPSSAKSAIVMQVEKPGPLISNMCQQLSLTAPVAQHGAQSFNSNSRPLIDRMGNILSPIMPALVLALINL